MPRIAWAKFEAEFLALYGPKYKAKATRTKMAQVLRELGEVAKTTADLTPASVDRWIDAHPKRAPVTVNGLLSYLRKACRYAVARGYLRSSPFEAASFRMPAPKAPKRRHLSRSDLSKLLDHLERGRATWEGGRLYALVAVLAYTGLRRNEALRLKVEDLDLAGGWLSVVARFRLKTAGSEARVPIPPACVRVLEEWSRRCGSEWLFPGVRLKGPWVHGSNGYRPVDAIKEASAAAGVPPTTGLMLRHTLATHARGHFGLGAKTVQQILRHADERTQLHYVEEDGDHLQSAARRIDFAAG